EQNFCVAKYRGINTRHSDGGFLPVFSQDKTGFRPAVRDVLRHDKRGHILMGFPGTDNRSPVPLIFDVTSRVGFKSLNPMGLRNKITPSARAREFGGRSSRGGSIDNIASFTVVSAAELGPEKDFRIMFILFHKNFTEIFLKRIQA